MPRYSQDDDTYFGHEPYDDYQGPPGYGPYEPDPYGGPGPYGGPDPYGPYGPGPYDGYDRYGPREMGVGPTFPGMLLILAGILGVINGLVIFYSAADLVTTLKDLDLEADRGIIEVTGLTLIAIAIFPLIGGIVYFFDRTSSVVKVFAIIGIFSFGPLLISSILSLVATVFVFRGASGTRYRYPGRGPAYGPGPYPLPYPDHGYDDRHGPPPFGPYGYEPPSYEYEQHSYAPPTYGPSPAGWPYGPSRRAYPHPEEYPPAPPPSMPPLGRRSSGGRRGGSSAGRATARSGTSSKVVKRAKAPATPGDAPSTENAVEPSRAPSGETPEGTPPSSTAKDDGFLEE
ncbi:MAG: tripartite tricarboxylate transporter TctB family protein [Thermoplasmata archaeon]|nr:tripartite tricarboxylate transporter TctB family protein [Thermoplasmata archaeon]